MKWSTPAPVFKWGVGIVGIILMVMVMGIWFLWDPETQGTIFVRDAGRILAGNFIWGYRFVLAVLLALAAEMVSQGKSLFESA